MKDIIELINKVQRISAESKLSMQEFEVAVQSNDVERQETARVKLHEQMDIRLDMIADVQRMKDKSMEELFKKLGTGKL